LALVALHAEPVGVDIELVTSWAPAQKASILPITERQRRSVMDDRRATSVWSSKEALAKALDTPIYYDPRRLESPAFWPNGAAGRWRAYRLNVPEAYEAWLCWRVCDANGHCQIREQ
jgi:phosphopantetheinyl transferase